MTRKSKFRAYLPFVSALTALVLVAGLAVYALVQMLGAPPPEMKRTVQQISLVRPPPPPPKPKEAPPPPEEIEEEVDMPDPQETPEPSPENQPPPGDLLGLDAEGTAGADGFGLVARKGGRDLLASGGGDPHRWYAGVLKQELVAHLSEYDRIRSRRYSVQVRLWLGEDGAVRDVDLAGTTGDRELDEELRTALPSLQRIADAPPHDLPQPVQLRIVSRL